MNFVLEKFIKLATASRIHPNELKLPSSLAGQVSDGRYNSEFLICRRSTFPNIASNQAIQSKLKNTFYVFAEHQCAEERAKFQCRIFIFFLIWDDFFAFWQKTRLRGTLRNLSELSQRVKTVKKKVKECAQKLEVIEERILFTEINRWTFERLAKTANAKENSTRAVKVVRSNLSLQ